jgi:Flp pilus assembly pilin Flp
MLRNFLKNKKAQNTAEYALLIALVVAGVIAMQTYAQRALQARIHDVSKFMASNTSNSELGIGNSTQYEPYYMQSNYDVNSVSADNKRLSNGIVEQDSVSNRQRAGIENTTYDTTGAAAITNVEQQ